MGGGFPGEVPGIELGDGGVEVFEFEPDDSRDTAVGIGLDDAEEIITERVLLLAEFGAIASQHEAITANRDDFDREFQPEISEHPEVFDIGIPTAADSGAGDPPAVVAVMIVGQNRSGRVPVARAEAGDERAFARLAAFSRCDVGRLSSSNLASAVSRSASSNSSERLNNSPSTASTWTSRHSASKPSCEIPRDDG